MNTFKQIRIIFFALIAGQIFYMTLALFIAGNDLISASLDYNSLFGFIIPVFIIILVISSKLLYRRLLSQQPRETSLDEKIKTYRTLNIIKFALLEGANFISITFYMLTGDFLYIGMSIIVLALNFIYFPGMEKFIEDFELTPEDMEKLQKI